MSLYFQAPSSAGVLLQGRELLICIAPALAIQRNPVWFAGAFEDLADAVVRGGFRFPTCVWGAVSEPEFLEMGTGTTAVVHWVREPQVMTK